MNESLDRFHTDLRAQELEFENWYEDLMRSCVQHKYLLDPEIRRGREER